MKKDQRRKKKLKPNRSYQVDKALDPLDEYNWQTISRYTSSHKNINVKELEAAKYSYVNGLKSQYDSGFLGAILFPEGIDSICMDVAKNRRKKNRFVRNIYNLQRDYHYYFGDNSLLCRREHAILDALDYGNEEDLDRYTEVVKAAYHRDVEKGTKPTLNDLLKNSYFSKYKTAYSLADHIVLDRQLVFWEAKLLGISNDMISTGINSNLTRIFLGAEIVSKYPERFHANILAFSREVKRIISSNNNCSILQECYEESVSCRLNDFSQTQPVGGEITVAVRYETEEHLQAMLQQMNPQTRFPVSRFASKDAIHHLVSHDGYERQSTALVNQMWRYGTVYEKHTVFESTTLIVGVKNHLSMTGSLLGFLPLSYNAINLEERYLSIEPHDGDEITLESKEFPIVVIIENIAGKIFVAHPNCSPVAIDECPSIRTIYNNSKSKEEFALEMLDRNNLSLLKTEIVRRMEANEG